MLNERGEIVTFYSYKGGTGRTMALANVACLLAMRSMRGAPNGVLVVDWDLEAPGLHRFFPPRLENRPSTNDLGLDATPGVIDLVGAIDSAIPDREPESEEAVEEAVRNAFEALDLNRFIADTNVPGVSILRAGRNDDRKYSQRVNTFNWENLFRRAPTVYRELAERLATKFRYVLVDSRTGVTDISGICTALLPEKLVVVFTPNRQSLTGVRDLVERATGYRRNSDDLRPLMIYPLPSRIEASREDLRTLWRFGSRDQNIAGYQPMFEELFAAAYGLPKCDLSEYFSNVQIQQTPDYAYGEEIAVRRTADRFSLANSYELFVERLAGTAPPWGAIELLAAPAPSSSSSPAAAPTPVAVPPPILAGPSPLPRAFLSFAEVDRDRVMRIAAALESAGLELVVSANLASAGAQSDRDVAEALDRSQVVVVCWSKASVGSDAVLAEAGEGLRRGILVPALLDPVSPPLSFRQVAAADLRRDFEGGIRTLVDAALQLARGTPGTISSPVDIMASSAPARTGAPSRIIGWALLAAAAFIVIAVGGMMLRLGSNAVAPVTRSTPSQMPVPPPASTLTIPDFVGTSVADAKTIGLALGTTLAFHDDRGVETSPTEGVVTAQVPAARAVVSPGTPIQLTIRTATVVVPTIVGKTLDEAVRILEVSRLGLGTPESRYVRDAKPGIILQQTPAPGATIASGGRVKVTVASASPAASSK